MRTRRRITLPAIVGAVVVLLAVGVIAFASLPTGDSRWSSAGEMRGSSEGLSVPTLVDDDARDIEVRVAQFDRSGVQIRWESAAGITRSDCKPGPISGTSQVGASWWPKSVPSKGWTCGWWKVFEDGGSYYAWHDPRTDGVR